MPTSRDEILAFVERARNLTRRRLDGSPGDARLQWIDLELNAIDSAVRSEWPPPENVAQRISIGRFAAREFEVDHLDLSRLLCELDDLIRAASRS
jgi:hypothetical protein